MQDIAEIINNTKFITFTIANNSIFCKAKFIIQYSVPNINVEQYKEYLSEIIPLVKFPNRTIYIIEHNNISYVVIDLKKSPKIQILSLPFMWGNYVPTFKYTNYTSLWNMLMNRIVRSEIPTIDVDLNISSNSNIVIDENRIALRQLSNDRLFEYCEIRKNDPILNHQEGNIITSNFLPSLKKYYEEGFQLNLHESDNDFIGIISASRFKRLLTAYKDAQREFVSLFQRGELTQEIFDRMCDMEIKFCLKIGPLTKSKEWISYELVKFTSYHSVYCDVALQKCFKYIKLIKPILCHIKKCMISNNVDIDIFDRI